ncbi:MAG: DUF5331 domain-containing protein [Elainellaceae cyanobacterium]
MNVQQLRQSLKHRWLNYYRDNQDWLAQLAIWVNDDGQRRPSASFILATLTVLEPRLTQLMPLVAGLNNNPDRIIAALGLNFSPDDELKSLTAKDAAPRKMLPAQSVMSPIEPSMAPPAKEAVQDAIYVERSPRQTATQQDEACGGRDGDNPWDR